MEMFLRKLCKAQGKSCWGDLPRTPSGLLALSLECITRFFRLFFLLLRKWQRLDGLLEMLRGRFPTGRPQGCSWKNIIFFWLQRALPTQSPMGAGSLLPGMLCHFSFANKSSRRFLLRLPPHVQPRCFQLSCWSFQEQFF